MSKKYIKQDKEKNNKITSKKLYVILLIIGFILSLCLLIILLVVNLNSSNENKNLNTSYDSKYRDALRYIANKEYKEYASINDEVNYIDHISSYGYKDNSFIYVAKTNLANNNVYLEISFSGSGLSSIDTSLDYLSNNYLDTSSINKDVTFYSEYNGDSSSFNSAINSYVSNYEKVIVDKYQSMNPQYAYYAISYLDNTKLYSLMGIYDLNVSPTDLLTSNIIISEIDISSESYKEVIIF